jgi:glycosyltransferase involved in cell wall biosynthesis
MSSFTPCYKWPNKVIPFRLYFSSSNLRIFIIENLQHNYDWISEYKNKIKPTDVFFVLVGWHYHAWLVDEAMRMFDALHLNTHQFHILFNDSREMDLFKSRGFNGDLINQNAWLDERLVMKSVYTDKIYDAIYVGRFAEFKRHYLAGSINSLALVAGDTHGAAESSLIPNHVYKNERTLSPDEVCLKINQSRCGLILSENEGACFASSEYLLCGVPVVSTFCEGGRDVWYNEYNSCVVDPDPIKVRNAVQRFLDEPRDPHKIRSDHVNLQYFYRAKFISLLSNLFKLYEIQDTDPVDYFWLNFSHKMRPYIAPKFDEIFGD